MPAQEPTPTAPDLAVDPVVVLPPTVMPLPAGGACDQPKVPRKRRRGWDDAEEQQRQKAALAASAASAAVMEKIVTNWKPSVAQLKAMSVAELQPLLKNWKVHIDPTGFTRDIMLARALKVIHNIVEYDP